MRFIAFFPTVATTRASVLVQLLQGFIPAPNSTDSDVTYLPISKLISSTTTSIFRLARAF